MAATTKEGPMNMLTQITRTQLERAVMMAKPPENVANEKSKAAARKLMDMPELVRERAQMQRLGFVDTVYAIDEELRFRREKRQAEKDEFEQTLLTQRMRALAMLHNRRQLQHKEQCASDDDAAAAQVAERFAFARSLHRQSHHTLSLVTAPNCFCRVSCSTKTSSKISLSATRPSTPG